MALADFDLDGALDIVLNHNFFGPQPETGFMDGGLGLLLRGDGSGDFSPVPPAESGLVIPEDATGLAVGDVDGDSRPDLAIATNGDDLRVYRNRGNGNRARAVRLLGTAGNPPAVGARVRLARPGGATQPLEVTAGSGYLSPSSAVLRFGLGSDPGAEWIEVRWPDGRTTTVRENLDAPSVVIAEP